MVWPIVFNYRHHVELVLKRMLTALSELSEEPVDIKSLGKHHLGRLWEDFKAFASGSEVKSRCSMEIAVHDLEGADDYIRQLSEVDPDSQAFRYPRGKEGQSLIPENLTCINLVVCYEHMERLCSFLDGLDSYIDVHIEVMNELRAEYWRETQAEYEEGLDDY